MQDNSTESKIAKFVFVVSSVLILIVGSYLYGMISYKDRLFPFSVIFEIKNELQELFNPSDNILSTKKTFTNKPIETFQSEKVAKGLVMIMGSIDGTRDTFVKIIERDGTLVHQWKVSWNDIWGGDIDTGHFPSKRIPQGDAGMYLHGIDILPEASIVANFELLSTFRMSVCGDVEWKLPNLGHHSVFYSKQGYLWVTAERYIEEGDTGYQNHRAPLRSWTVQKLSLDGEVLQEIPMIDLLLKNDLYGLVYMTSGEREEPQVSGDTLHLNDIDEFPVGMESDIFEAGDLLVSFRNISTIIVFDPETLEVKFVSNGHFF